MTREEARSVGLTRYHDGAAPCVRGHEPIFRTVSRNKCTQCLKERNALWRHANPEKHKATRDAWRFANADRVKEKSRIWCAANAERKKAKQDAWNAANPDKRAASNRASRIRNKDAGKASTKAWRAANPDWVRANSHRRRARLRSAEGTHTGADIGEILIIQKWKCAYCKTSVRKSYHVDHILPLFLGGSNDRANLQILCVSCNSKKGRLHPVKFAHKIGLLV